MPTHKIICGKSEMELKQFEDERIDLVVTSPPYDNLRDYKGYTFDFKTTAKELFRVVKEGGVVVWVVGDATINGSETGTSFKQALFFKEIGFNLHDTMIYQKRNYKPINAKRYDNVFEYMFILSKGQPTVFNPIKVATVRTRKEKSKFRDKYGNLNEKEYVGNSEKKRTNIWGYAVGRQIANNKIAFNHPAIFPEQLANDHIISWSNAGDTILDPFVGSGTTLVEAERSKRNSIGIDSSKEYCKDTYKRLKNEMEQTELGKEHSTIEKTGF